MIDLLLKILYRTSYQIGRMSKRFRLFYYKKFDSTSPWGLIQWIKDNQNEVYDVNNQSTLTQKEFNDFLKDTMNS